MRVRAITPMHVGPVELRRRQQRYDRLCPPGLTLHLDDLPDAADVPRALDTAADIRRSEELVLAEAGRTDPETYDAVLPDCVLDPAVGTTNDTPVPVVGILQAATHLLAAVGQRFAAVTRNQPIADELARKARSYGLGELLTEVRVLGLSAADIPNDTAWAAAITRTVDGLPVAAVVNGCSAVEVPPATAGPVIVDPTATALRVLALGAELGLADARPVAAR